MLKFMPYHPLYHHVTSHANDPLIKPGLAGGSSSTLLGGLVGRKPRKVPHVLRAIVW